MRDDGPRWDERYRAATTVDPHQPEALDRWPEAASLLPTVGRCLDLASGPGSTALWAAERGLTVTAVDASAVAIELLRTAAIDLGHGDRIDARVVDLDHGIPSDIVDSDLIVCQRFRDPELSTALIGRLRVGGYAIVTVLSTVGAPLPGEFHAPPGALRDEFAADERCEIVHHDEGDGVAHIVVRRC